MIDSEGIIYGHLISGDPSKGICHIVPAGQSFEEMKRLKNGDLALAEPWQATSSLAVVESPDTLVESFEANSPDRGPSLPALDVIIEPALDESSRRSSLPSRRITDLEQGVRSRVGKKRLSKEPTTPTISQKDRSPTRRRRFLKPLHFWIDPLRIVDRVKPPHFPCLLILNSY